MRASAEGSGDFSTATDIPWTKYRGFVPSIPARMAPAFSATSKRSGKLGGTGHTQFMLTIVYVHRIHCL
jgi:hypothetical protein